MEKVAAALATLSLTANAFQEKEKADGSYYQFVDAQADEAIAASSEEMSPEIQELYYYYYYDGPSVVAIVFLDILLPIVCCIAIIVTILCVVKHIRKRRLRELETIERAREAQLLAAQGQGQDPGAAPLIPGQVPYGQA